MGSRVRVPPGSPLVLIDKSGPAPCVFAGAGTGSVSTGKTSDIYRSRAQPTRSSVLGPLGIRDLAAFEIERVTVSWAAGEWIRIRASDWDALPTVTCGLPAR